MASLAPLKLKGVGKGLLVGSHKAGQLLRCMLGSCNFVVEVLRNLPL